ncbi:MAG: DUF1501 domain-containing protein [Planctomycetes bacterium]|nr:DUF1501 domain-containing protein [Planctomycetota bacterium]
MSEPTTPYSRRFFLQHGVALASMVTTIPQFIQNSALGMISQLAGNPGGAGLPQDRILVVVQLGGGNDGLNTVIPFGMNDYYNARPTIGIPAPNGTARGQTGVALMLDQQRGLGLNPSLRGLKSLYDDGKLAVLQGVGYPNPNRSHFTSMDIWQTAKTDAKGNGWIGRYFDNTCNGTPLPEGSISIGRTAPLALNGQLQKPISFESAELFRWLGKDLHKSLDEPYQQINRAGTLPETTENSQAAFLMRTALDAQLSSDRIRAAVGKTPLTTWPNSDIADQLRIVSALIRDGLSTRVYYVSKSGFDTHAGQLGSHGRTLQQVGDALAAFQKELAAQHAEDRVITMVFSEFGRRVKQNASGGTDHGTAAPMFVIGSKVKAGVHGDHPSLTDLDQGDLKFKQDFRGVYANILDEWMKAPSAKILGGTYGKSSIIKA